MSTTDTPSPQSDVQAIPLAEDLTRFRQRVEQEAGEPIEHVELNAALLLSDLCRFLQLGADQRQRVLGRSATAFTRDVLDTSVKLRRAHQSPGRRW